MKSFHKRDSKIGPKVYLGLMKITISNADSACWSMTQNTFGQNSVWKCILWIEASFRLSIKTWNKKIISPWTTLWERRPFPRHRTRRRGGWLRGCARTRGSKGCCSVSNRWGPDNLKPSFSHPSVLTNLESCYFAVCRKDLDWTINFQITNKSVYTILNTPFLHKIGYH